ncbi:pentose kinase [Spirochaetia bacterium]|nr:pentose kinase [Spirochaetia bacterium]
MNNLIAWDLGTGGLKASIIDENGGIRAETFKAYETTYPHDKWCEQKPLDWWEAVCISTGDLLAKTGIKGADIAGAALSGHSLVTVPIDREGNPIAESVPIWCDMRAGDAVEEFFRELPYDEWYLTTGNGDPPACYSIMKLMWMKKHQSDVYSRTKMLLGSKDFINYMLTGRMCTDPSYASGFGVFNLKAWDYEERFFRAAGIKREIFPEIMASDAVAGTITAAASRATGLPEGLPVASGGVDNMCMALGMTGLGEGRAYTSLGSSSWIAVNSPAPIVDVKTRPFVFAHAQKGMYTSAVSIFSAGNSFRWAHDTFFKDISYNEMDALAEAVPAGSGGIIFNPTLAGGSAQEPSPNMHGVFTGLSLGTSRGQLIRASLEGVAMALNATLEILKTQTPLANTMLICGGGSKSALWRQIFSDVYCMEIIKTNIDQGAATLGAAALAANAAGVWKGYDMISSFHKQESVERPDPERVAKYQAIFPLFQKIAAFSAELGDEMETL